MNEKGEFQSPRVLSIREGKTVAGSPSFRSTASGTPHTKTKAEARRKLAELKREMLPDSTPAQLDTPTLNGLLDTWLEVANLRPTTLAHYSWALGKYVRPKLGAIPLSYITPLDLQRLYREVGGVRVPEKVHRLMHRAFKMAVMWDWLPSNPAERVVPPRYKPARRKMWSQEQLRTFLLSIAGHRYETFWLLALATGLRSSELLGLQCSDVDLDANTLTVRRSRVKQRDWK